METARNNMKANLLKSLTAILMAVNIQPALSSIVQDGMERNVIKVSDYCPRTPHCEEGSHVICMYYNPDRVAGPLCASYRNITITQQVADIILQVVNRLRGKFALGKGIGNEGYFPKAYGLMRLKWDSELATFAQVLANQCTVKRDLCRASNKFPNPGQNVAMLRFAMKDWRVRRADPMLIKINSSELHRPGYNNAKLRFAVYKLIETWYNNKDNMEIKHVYNYPNMADDPKYVQFRPVGNLISGSATHIGCGVTAFLKYTHNNATLNTYNVILLVCNISGKPKPGTPLYETEPPTRVGYTIKCGCPPGYDEDDDCLCYENPQPINTTDTCFGDKSNCKPAVVLLPIVTAEDEPPARDQSWSRRRHNDVTVHMPGYGGIRKDDDYGNFLDDENNGINNEYITKSRNQNYKDIWTKQKIRDVKNRYFDKTPEKVRQGYNTGRLDDHKSVNVDGENLNTNLLDGSSRYKGGNSRQERVRFNHEKDNSNFKEDSGHTRRQISHKESNSGNDRGAFSPLTNWPQEHLPIKRVSRKSPQYTKGSIFSRMPKFELPQSSYSQKKTLKADVAPRKDFENTKILLDNYLKTRRGDDAAKSSMLLSNTKDDQITPTHTKDLNKYLTNKFSYQEMKDYEKYDQNKPIEVKTITEEADQKFMNLLDTLEREVKHIELNMKEKEIFDTKIRKIYGQIVGKPVETLLPKNVVDTVAEPHTDKKEDFTKYERAVDNHLTMDKLDRTVDNHLTMDNLDRTVDNHLTMDNLDRTVDNHLTMDNLDRTVDNHFTMDNLDRTVDNHLKMDNLDRNKPFIPQTRPQKSLGFEDSHLKPYMESPRDEISKMIGKRRNFKASHQSSPNQLPFDYKKINEHKSLNYRRKSLDVLNNIKTNDNYEYLSDSIKNRFDEVINVQKRPRNPFENEETKKDFNGLKHDVLDIDRRKYYQDKLDRIKKTLHTNRGISKRNEHERERQRRLEWSSLRQDIDKNSNIEMRRSKPEILNSNYYDLNPSRRFLDL